MATKAAIKDSKGSSAIGNVMKVAAGAVAGFLFYSAVGSFQLWNDSGIENKFTTHKECEENYYSCGLHDYQVTLAWLQAKRDLQALFLSTCGRVASFGGNTVWKPMSENDGKAALVMKSSYCSNGSSLVSNVQIVGNNGRVIDTMRYTGCEANGGRNHQRANKTASELAASAPLTVTYDFGGVKECLVVQDPRERLQ